MTAWFPTLHRLIGLACFIAAIFFLDDARDKLMAIAFGLVVTVRGDTIEILEDLKMWRRM
jgi:hypothetical protein